MFSDESWFSLGLHDRFHGWRKHGKYCSSTIIVEQHTSITPGVTIWSAITYDTQSPSVILCSILTVWCYVNDILWPVALPMLSRLSGIIFQHDNACPHTMNISGECLCNVTTLLWPAWSPDLMSLEQVWDMVGCWLQPSQSMWELALQLEHIWQQLLQNSIQHLYESMLNWISSCITARGGLASY